MKEITYFYLKHCPHCRKADEIIETLKTEHPEYAGIPITKIDEQKESEIADQYEYFYVPCLWIGDRKIHEGVPTTEKIETALRLAME